VEALAIAPSAAPAEDQTANDATSTTTGSDDASTDATPAQ
jgi:hypothetical protein